MQVKSPGGLEFALRIRRRSSGAMVLAVLAGCGFQAGCGRLGGADRRPTKEIAMPKTTVNGIEVEGSDAFVSRTTEALTLLAASKSFGEVKKYLGRIKESQRSGMRAYDKPPTYEVGEATSKSNVIWYASTIAPTTPTTRSSTTTPACAAARCPTRPGPEPKPRRPAMSFKRRYCRSCAKRTPPPSITTSSTCRELSTRKPTTTPATTKNGTGSRRHNEP